MAMTAAQLARMRRLIGDTGTTPMFSDDELNTIYTDSGDVFNAALVECFDVLLADAAKRVTYRQGQSFEDDNKLFEHLEKQRSRWAKIAGVGSGTVQTGALTFDYYDDDGTDIPDDDDEDEYTGWLLN